MSEFKGTPGPWIASDYYCDSTTIIDGSGFSVADAPRCIIREGWSDMGFQHWAASDEAHRWISEDEQRANANLIAAAPELLEALQELVHADCHSVRNSTVQINALRKAHNIITKALGQ